MPVKRAAGAYFEEEFARLFELMDSGYIDHEVNIRVEDIYEKGNRLLL